MSVTNVQSLSVVNYGVFSHDVTTAMLVSRTSPVGVENVSYVNALFVSNKSA